MTALDDMLAQVNDPSQRDALRAELARLAQSQPLGLVFERHPFEALRLYGRQVQVGASVHVESDPDSPVWTVINISGEMAQLRRQLASESVTIRACQLADLVVVQEPGERIYPVLASCDQVARGGDKPFHLVIKGENLHALELLEMDFGGRVDCVFVDPPFNTGARDWKYADHYACLQDRYRHSTWLAFMERRFQLAKRLLNPIAGVLVVMVDEREVHRLALLLEQVFVGANQQTITITTNRRGVERAKRFTRVNEFAIFVFLGETGPVATADDFLIGAEVQETARPIRWEGLKASGSARREDRPNLFYPVYVDPLSKSIQKVGGSPGLNVDRTSVAVEPGLITVWPLSQEGEELRWKCSAEVLRSLASRGFAKVGKTGKRPESWTILYLNRGSIRQVERGELVEQDAGDNHRQELYLRPDAKRIAKTVWNRSRHNAALHGSKLLSALVPGHDFPYPKSLYVVEDLLRVAIGERLDAVVLDFFAGSGTTAHAVMRLNHQDGGSRRSILVTDNQVGRKLERELRSRGLSPGDQDWECHGIYESITKPRLRAAVTGLTPRGSPVSGDYRFIDEFPMRNGFEENVDFIEVRY